MLRRGSRCSRDVQGELEWQIIPTFSMARNSSSAMRCFSGSNCQGRPTRGRRYLCQCDAPRRGVVWEGRRLGAAETEIRRAAVVPVAGARQRRRWSGDSRGQ